MLSINPKNKKIIAEHAEDTAEIINQKLATAQNTFESWKNVEYTERAFLMQKAADYLRTNKSKFARTATDEVGKTLAAAEAEVEKCAIVCEYYAQNTENILQREIITTDATESYARFDPIGIVLAVMPWNFPYWQVFRFAAPALMAGNIGVLKHASNVQMCAQVIEETFLAAGFPAGCFTNLAVKASGVEAIIRDQRVKAVTLTGSEKAGSEVAKVAGEVIKKTVLELGGSDPFIVMADADLDAAASAAVIGRMQNNAGQSCIAAKRFIVHKSVASEFMVKLKSEVTKLVVGDPTDPSTTMGPLTNEQMVIDVENQVNESVAMGAVIESGGMRGDESGYYYLPTILSSVTSDMPVFNQETFGPALPVITFSTDQEAIDLANDSIYGLGATIFTGDTKKAQELAKQINSGCVFINNFVKSDSRLPFGGIKNSGYGRELSTYGIKEFVNIKTIYIK